MTAPFFWSKTSSMTVPEIAMYTMRYRFGPFGQLWWFHFWEPEIIHTKCKDFGEQMPKLIAFILWALATWPADREFA